MSSLVAESWTWYGLTWLVVAVRMASQFLLRGSIKALKPDDALMMLAMITDTTVLVTINIISRTSSNLIDPNENVVLTPDEISTREFGSKMVLVTEQVQLITTWLVKACLLFMYHRLTLSLKGNLVVKIVAGYVAVGFVVMEILYLGVWCRPFSQYWAVPPENPQCSTATNHLITNAVLNISSDIMIILIPMPMFLQSSIPIKKKIILVGVFALGGFTILSAILNKYYSFSQPFGSQWTFWYVRESSTAIIAANLPLTWTLFRRMFNLRSFGGGSTKTQSGPATSNLRSQQKNTARSVARSYNIRGYDDDIDAMSSQEQINKGYGMPLEIYQHRDVHVSSEPATSTDRHRSESQDSLPEGLTTTTIEAGYSLNREKSLRLVDKPSTVRVTVTAGV